jgi:mono/diheme cytochrome c family protein
MTRKSFLLIFLIALGLVACNPVFESPLTPDAVESTDTPGEEVTNQQTGMGMRMDPGSGMMARHHAPIPAEYAGITNPIQADEASLERGAELYAEYCVNCHGDGGMGDGPAGQALDPLPAPIAHTSRMLGDDYMFWRISEGGLHEPFGSAMPRWQDVLDDDARWDVINYVRAMGSGQVMPGQQMGGAAFDPEAEAAKHAEMTAKGVQQGLITQLEADTFLAVHDELDKLMAAGMAGQSGNMENMQSIMLNQLLEDGHVTEDESTMFSDVHDRLVAAGLME